MARTRKVLYYANSGGGEYLCEFSSLVLMTSLVRISESGRREDKIERKGSVPRKEAVKPGKLRRSVPWLIFLSILSRDVLSKERKARQDI